MSLITGSTAQAHDYAASRIEQDNDLILVVYTDGVSLVVAPLDSDTPNSEFLVVGTFYWHNDGLDFMGVALLD